MKVPLCICALACYTNSKGEEETRKYVCVCGCCMCVRAPVYACMCLVVGGGGVFAAAPAARVGMVGGSGSRVAGR